MEASGIHTILSVRYLLLEAISHPFWPRSTNNVQKMWMLSTTPPWQIAENFQGIGYVVQYNFTGLHTAPLFQSLADQALARYATGNRDITITTTIAPLPITKIEQSFGEAEDAFLAWFLVSQ